MRLKDIAADLNLSKMTISKVLRGQTDISEATKARVLKRVKELNYIPNLSASSLRTGETKTIGLILPSIGKPCLAEIAAGVHRVVAAAGYSVIVCSSDDDLESEQRQVEILVSLQVDALLIVSLQETAAFFEQMPKIRPMPLIFVSQMPAAATESYVGVREEEVGWLAAHHLAKCGCKRIAYLRGPRTLVGDLRADGYRRALRECGLSASPDLVIATMNSDRSEYAHGHETMERLLGRRGRPDGVMAYTDLMTVGAMDAATRSGIRIPDEIRFVGCGDDPLLCRMRIPLTSIDTCESDLGQRAGRLALRAIANGNGTGPQKALVKPRLVKRESSEKAH
ncbi:MAG TPA: LacI family DNA-binding transcriptional regulator [Terracidiphilus sp.]|nr:LacI family DNA-binding transcriptional regulator [Terracidiphilus sp.]